MTMNDGGAGKNLLATSLLLLAALAAAARGALAQPPREANARREYLQQFAHSLKGDLTSLDWKQWPGRPGDPLYVKNEESGLRITMPAGRAGERLNVISTGIRVKGDFEITARFEILQEPGPAAAGTLTRLALTTALDRPNDVLATLMRGVTAEGAQFLTWRTPAGNPFPSAATTGSLRLVRTGGQVAYYASEGANGDFKFLEQHDFSPDNLKDVRLVVQTGGPNAALDVRFSDLSIRADTVTRPSRPADVVDKTPPRTDYPQEYYHSFKGNPEKPAAIKLFGPDARKCVHFEQAGLRIQLPAGVPGARRGAGVTVGVSGKGDFEITVGFEVLQETEPSETREASRLTVDVGLVRAKHHVATLSRAISEGVPAHYRPQASLPSDSGANATQGGVFPARAQSGQLRLVRRGPVVSYHVWEAGTEFRLLQQYSLGTADLENVRIVGRLGSPQAVFDVRVTDIRIRADSLSEVSRPVAAVRENASPEASSPASPSPEKGRKVPWSLLIAVSLLTVLAVSVCLCMYWRRRAPDQAKAGPAANHREQSPAASAKVSLPCSGCGIKLKVRAALAGKKIKCPRCSRAVLVPHSEV